MADICPERTSLTIQLPRSKSILIRKLIIGFLYENKIGDITSEDAADVHIVHRNLQLIALRQSPKKIAETRIDVEDCGTAFRFLMALLAVTEGNWFLCGTERLLSRPIAPLMKALQNIGAEIIQTESGFRIHGKEITASEINIEGGLSSQWVSALLLIAGKIKLNKLILTSPVFSYPYLDLTCTLLTQSGFHIEKKANTYSFTHDNLTINSAVIKEESDWSAAAFWYAVATLFPDKKIVLQGLSLTDLQGDTIVAEWFRILGIDSLETKSGITLYRFKQNLSQPITFDLSAHPDISLILAVLAVLLPFDVVLNGLNSLNLKESDRLTILSEKLSSFAPVELQNNSQLFVKGTSRQIDKNRTLYFDSYGDHRLVMAFSLFSFFYSTEITHQECINKSYPNFWQDVAKFRLFIY